MSSNYVTRWLWLILIGVCLGFQGNRQSAAQDQRIDSPQLIISAEWHPEGEGLLVSGRADMEEWGLWVYDANLQLVRFFPNDSSVSTSWSPDGSRFVMGRNIIDANTLEVVFTLQANSGIGGWSADGTQLLALENETTLGFYNATTGRLMRSLPMGNMLPDAVSWSPDSQFLLFIQPTGMIDVIDANSGRLITTFPLEYQYPIGLNWSNDSRYLAAGFIREVEPGTNNLLPYAAGPTLASVVVWDVMTGDKIHQFDGLMDTPLILRWNPHKPELVAGTGLGLVYIWDVNTGELVDTLTTLGGLSDLDYSPFGGRLLITIVNTNQAAADLLNSQREALVEQEAYWTQSIIPNVLEIIVPNPSAALLDQVEQACVPASISAGVNALDPVAATSDYITAIERNVNIPPGCRADLLAVAAALQAQ
jgi:hypothetical protein